MAQFEVGANRHTHRVLVEGEYPTRKMRMIDAHDHGKLIAALDCLGAPKKKKPMHGAGHESGFNVSLATIHVDGAIN